MGTYIQFLKVPFVHLSVHWMVELYPVNDFNRLKKISMRYWDTYIVQFDPTQWHSKYQH